MAWHDVGVPLTGSLLVASPKLTDPNFAMTVVMMIHHDDDGAVGVILNRPTSLSVDRLPAGWTTDDPVYSGGPVDPEMAIGIVESPDDHEAWERVVDRLWLADLDGPPAPVSRIRIFSGYAGWGAGQVESELERGDWIVSTASSDDVFTTSPDDLWRSVMRRQPGAARLLATYPVDPSLN